MIVHEHASIANRLFYQCVNAWEEHIHVQVTFA